MKRMIVWDHSGECPAKYLVNIGPAMEQYNWSNRN